MGIQQNIREKPVLGIAFGVVLIAISLGVLTRYFWPEKRPINGVNFYSDDDGRSWFVDTAWRVAPFDHDGKTAVMASIFSYDNGSKKFCAYLMEYRPEAKKQLDDAIADAARDGKPASSVTLFQDRTFREHGLMVKKPGAGNPWIAWDDPKANQVFAIHSPDGSEPDEVFSY